MPEGIVESAIWICAAIAFLWCLWWCLWRVVNAARRRRLRRILRAADRLANTGRSRGYRPGATAPHTAVARRGLCG